MNELEIVANNVRKGVEKSSYHSQRFNKLKRGQVCIMCIWDKEDSFKAVEFIGYGPELGDIDNELKDCKDSHEYYFYFFKELLPNGEEGLVRVASNGKYFITYKKRTLHGIPCLVHKRVTLLK